MARRNRRQQRSEPRQVEIESMYNTDRYRPRYDHKRGLPIFLTRA